MSHRRGPKAKNPRRGSPSKPSSFLLAEIERGYTVHHGMQWVESIDSNKPKRLMQHRPDVKYVSPIRNYEKHQLLRSLRKSG